MSDDPFSRDDLLREICRQAERDADRFQTERDVLAAAFDAAVAGPDGDWDRWANALLSLGRAVRAAGLWPTLAEINRRPWHPAGSPLRSAHVAAAQILMAAADGDDGIFRSKLHSLRDREVDYLEPFLAAIDERFRVDLLNAYWGTADRFGALWIGDAARVSGATPEELYHHLDYGGETSALVRRWVRSLARSPVAVAGPDPDPGAAPIPPEPPCGELAPAIPDRPEVDLLSARELAVAIGMPDRWKTVETALRRIAGRTKDCRVEVQNSRTGEARYRYRVSDVWPELLHKWVQWSAKAGVTTD